LRPYSFDCTINFVCSIRAVLCVFQSWPQRRYYVNRKYDQPSIFAFLPQSQGQSRPQNSCVSLSVAFKLDLDASFPTLISSMIILIMPISPGPIGEHPYLIRQFHRLPPTNSTDSSRLLHHTENRLQAPVVLAPCYPLSSSLPHDSTTTRSRPRRPEHSIFKRFSAGFRFGLFAHSQRAIFVSCLRLRSRLRPPLVTFDAV
jgi:hypothetical protein